MTTIGSTNAFLTWFSEWGQVIYIGVQMLFWIAIAAAALVVALQYRRFVTHKVGKADTSRAIGAHSVGSALSEADSHRESIDL